MDSPLTLASDLEQEGLAYSRRGEYRQALETFRRMLTVLRERAARMPDDSQAVRYVALGMSRCGGSLRHLHRYEEAISILKDALLICEREAKKHPADPDVQRDLSIRCDNLGDVYREMGRAKKALRYAERSLRLARGLLATSPEDRLLRYDLAVSLQKLAWTTRKTGRKQESYDLLKEMTSVVEALTRDFPEDVDVSGFVASSYSSLGLGLIDLDRPAEAVVCLERSIDRYGALLAVGESSPSLHHDYSLALQRAGKAEARVGESALAVRHLREALKQAYLAAEQAPEDEFHAWGPVHAHLALGLALQRIGDIAGAREHALLATRLKKDLLGAEQHRRI